MKRTLAIVISGLSAMGFALSAHAGPRFCYYLSGAAASPAAPITANGLTPVALPGLTAANIAAGNCDELWILNGINGTPDAQVTGNTAAVAAFVAAGHFLSFNDRNVDQGASASTYIPGAGALTFVTELAADLNVDPESSTSITNGPWGVIGNTTLDGGNFSNHGYVVDNAALEALTGLHEILDTGDPLHVADFTYSFGAGHVYYSTIPLDFYLSGVGNDPPATAMRNIYARNEAAFQAGLVPEPASMALLGIGLAGLGFARRRKAS